MVRVWTWRTGELICEGLEHNTAVRFAAFVNDGNLVISADHTSLRVWDIETGRQIAPPLPHSLPPHAFVWCPDNSMAVGNGQSFVFNFQTSPQLHALKQPTFPQLGELISGRRIQRHGTVNLSTDQWEGVLRDLSRSGDRPFAVLESCFDSKFGKFSIQLQSLLHGQHWTRAVDLIGDTSPAEVPDLYLLTNCVLAFVKARNMELQMEINALKVDRDMAIAEAKNATAKLAKAEIAKAKCAKPNFSKNSICYNNIC